LLIVPSHQNVRKRKVIHSKERNTVKNVLKFFEDKATSGSLSLLIQEAEKRAAAATGVSIRTIACIKKEANVSTILSMPGNEENHRKPEMQF